MIFDDCEMLPYYKIHVANRNKAQTTKGQILREEYQRIFKIFNFIVPLLYLLNSRENIYTKHSKIKIH